MDAGSLDAGALIDAAIEHAAAGYDASQYPRTTCCSKKRKFYCPECFSLLGKDKIEGSDKTEGSDNPNPSATLPFDVDVILHDDKDVATGVHIKVLAQSQTNIIDFDGKGKDPEIPDYDPAITYILFPSDTSVPLSSLPPPAKLVVLDCKWSKTISSQHPSLRDLPKVHLSNPPAVSRYWRWHGKGEGMVCTLEAVYCAALECASVKQTPISNLQVSDERRGKRIRGAQNKERAAQNKERAARTRSELRKVCYQPLICHIHTCVWAPVPSHPTPLPPCRLCFTCLGYSARLCLRPFSRTGRKV